MQQEKATTGRQRKDRVEDATEERASEQDCARSGGIAGNRVKWLWAGAGSSRRKDQINMAAGRVFGE